MPLRFQLAVKGAKKLDFAMSQLAAEINDWTALWPTVINTISRIEANQFAQEGGRGPGGKWKELTPEYAKRKQKTSPGALILQTKENKLYQSLIFGGEGHVEELKPKSMRYGTTIPYALFHQLGTVKMAARPIFDFKQDDHLLIARAMQRVALAKATRLGFAIGRATGQRDLSRAEATSLGRQALRGEIPMPVSGAI